MIPIAIDVPYSFFSRATFLSPTLRSRDFSNLSFLLRSFLLCAMISLKQVVQGCLPSTEDF